MGKYVRCPNIKNIDAAVRLYYETYELSSADIREIFWVKSSQTISKLKNIVREEMTKAGRLPYDPRNVPTDIAFKAWGLDIGDLERRRAKLMKMWAIQERQIVDPSVNCADTSLAPREAMVAENAVEEAANV